VTQEEKEEIGYNKRYQEIFNYGCSQGFYIGFSTAIVGFFIWDTSNYCSMKEYYINSEAFEKEIDYMIFARNRILNNSIYSNEAATKAKIEMDLLFRIKGMCHNRQFLIEKG
jgi:hypothetical protein